MRLKLNHLIFAIPFATIICAQPSGGSKNLRIDLPGSPWSLEIAAPSFKVTATETKPDGRRYLEANDSKSGVVLSAFLEQGPGPATLDGCHQEFQDRLKSLAFLKPSAESERQQGQFAIQEYVIEEYEGNRIHQKNTFACAVKENLFADVHLSHAPFSQGDDALFAEILNAIHFVDNIPSTATSLDLFRLGSRQYIANDFAGAAGFYQRALDLERTHRELDSPSWRVLLDNLAMSYGITGKDGLAEDVLKYGLTKDPEYPMFYFLLGDVYAERGDLDHTIEYLTAAFKYRQNVIPGETLPDPRTDDSFRAFLKNDRFLKFLDSQPK
jgi:tetratricopeptide (TPR) repeat protein